MKNKLNGLKCILVIILAFYFIQPLSAKEKNYQFGFDLSVGIPQGEFRDNLDKSSFGVGVNIAMRISDSPFLVGIEFELMNYGEKDVNLTSNRAYQFDMLLGHTFLRFAPVKKGRFRPYAEGLVGANYLYTDLVLKDDGPDEEDTTIETVSEHVAFSVGIGAGIQVYLDSYKKKVTSKRIDFLLDIRVRYFFGGNAKYLQKGSVEINNNETHFNFDESRTNFINMQMGLAVHF
jgi:Outer membrane protein beta-barrel domain